MASPPRRIVHRRGLRLHAGAKVVARPSRWGNPWAIGSTIRVPGAPGKTIEVTRDVSLALYEQWARERVAEDPSWASPLIGYDLACYCPLGERCHGDILLALAEGPF